MKCLIDNQQFLIKCSKIKEGKYHHKFNCFQSWRRDLNPRPADYKSAALPVELRQHSYLNKLIIILHFSTMSRQIMSYFLLSCTL